MDFNFEEAGRQILPPFEPPSPLVPPKKEERKSEEWNRETDNRVYGYTLGVYISPSLGGETIPEEKKVWKSTGGMGLIVRQESSGEGGRRGRRYEDKWKEMARGKENGGEGE